MVADSRCAVRMHLAEKFPKRPARPRTSGAFGIFGPVWMNGFLLRMR